MPLPLAALAAGGAGAGATAGATAGAGAATAGAGMGARSAMASMARNFAIKQVVTRSAESNGHGVSSSQFPVSSPDFNFAPSPNNYVDNETARW